MASAADNGPVPGPQPGGEARREPVADETALEPAYLIAMSDAVTRTGALMLKAGTGSFRVRQSMRRAAAALGIDRLQALITLREIVTTATWRGIFRTQVVEVAPPGVDASLLADLEELTSSLPEGTTAAELNVLLDAVEQRPKQHGTRRLVLAAGIACMAFAFLNNNNWSECAVVGVAAACGRLVQLALASRKVNQLAAVLVTAAVASTVYVAATAAIRGLGQGASQVHASAFTSSILFLVPGFPMMTAALDLARSDLAAGIQRLSYAGLIIFSAAFGAWMVVAVTGVSPAAAPVPALGLPVLDTLRLIAGFAGVLGFAVGFNTPWRFALGAAGIGSVANTARLTATGLHLPQQFAAAGAAFIVGVASVAVARYLGSPRIILSVPAILIMIPGAVAFRALVYLNDGQVTLALSNGIQAALVVASLATGLAIARVVTDRGWTLE